MAPKTGDTVRVHYKGTLDDGTEFDSSEGRDPLEFVVGSGQVIPGFESAVAGMELGDSKKVTIPVEDAYGDRSDDAMQEVPMSAFGEDRPQAGWMVELAAPDGNRIAATVADVGDDTVKLDFNHPLAGENLTFELELVGVEQES